MKQHIFKISLFSRQPDRKITDTDNLEKNRYRPANGPGIIIGLPLVQVAQRSNAEYWIHIRTLFIDMLFITFNYL